MLAQHTLSFSNPPAELARMVQQCVFGGDTWVVSSNPLSDSGRDAACIVIFEYDDASRKLRPISEITIWGDGQQTTKVYAILPSLVVGKSVEVDIETPDMLGALLSRLLEGDKVGHLTTV